jgi:hypothetical protein
MNYKELTDTIYPDFVEYILDKHSKEIKDLYRGFIDEYLNESLGELNPRTRNKLTKELLNRLIQ